MDIIPTAKANIIFDPSNFDLFEMCPCRYNYRVNLRRGLPNVAKNKSLDYGSTAHEGFQAYYNALKEGVKFAERLDLAALKMRTFTSDPANSNLTVEETEGLIVVIQTNLDFWRWEDELFTIHIVEQPFAYTLYEDENIRIIMTGKMDLVVDKPALGQSHGYNNLPIDHKTYSRDGIVYRLSNQFQAYAAAVESNYLIVNRVGLQKSLKPEEKFKRLPLSYDPVLLQQWKDNVIKTILTQYCSCVGENVWPMNFTSCNKFNRLCEYYEVCDSSGEDTKKWKLEQNYVDSDPWDVTRILED